jgi:hypothetical protein
MPLSFSFPTPATHFFSFLFETGVLLSCLAIGMPPHLGFSYTFCFFKLTYINCTKHRVPRVYFLNNLSIHEVFISTPSIFYLTHQYIVNSSINYSN